MKEGFQLFMRREKRYQRHVVHRSNYHPSLETAKCCAGGMVAASQHISTYTNIM